MCTQWLCIVLQHESRQTELPCHPKGRRTLRQSLCRLRLCCENKSDTSISFPFLYPRFKEKSVSGPRHFPSPVAKLLTPPWAENLGDTPADEFLEMFRTTKLGRVTGNLSGLVLADISDTSLSTQEGVCFNQSPSWPQTQTPAEGGWLGESPQVYHLGSAQEKLAACVCVWVGGMGVYFSAVLVNAVSTHCNCTAHLCTQYKYLVQKYAIWFYFLLIVIEQIGSTECRILFPATYLVPKSEEPDLLLNWILKYKSCMV